MTDPGPLMHPRFLPFTEQALIERFAPVPGPRADHLAYYRASLARLANYEASVAAGSEPDDSVRLAHQIEKDERFWTVNALLTVYQSPQRQERFATLLGKAGVAPVGGYADWSRALDGDLELFFEVNMPAPTSYIHWLSSHLADRMPIEHLNAQAQKRLRRLEGATKVDAMLLAPATGVAVLFECKALSDISTHVTFDIARNQLARNIDVMLEEPKDRACPLSKRRPTHTALVLVTPRLFRDGADGEDRSRLYGWLMPAYRDPNGDLLARHLRHRDLAELVDVHARLGWLTWEEIEQESAAADGGAAFQC